MSIEEYVNKMPEDRREAVNKIRRILKKNLPKGYEEAMSYGMIGYIIPKSIYPKGYHVNPELPIGIMALANQKHYVALYHVGMMIFPDVLAWFESEYAKRVPTKLDMGKSCIRFRNMKLIPYDLIEELAKKITPAEYIEHYEAALAKRK